jgi:indolepyruvate ferredoxin oxidoreductase
VDDDRIQITGAARGLRGTTFDVFGYTAERRRERALIGEYKQTIAALCPRLPPPITGR